MKVLVTGAGGMLAHAVLAELGRCHHTAVPVDRAALDITDPAAVLTALRRHRPEAVIHCAAYTRVDDAEADEQAAYAVNAEGTANVATACADVGARLVYPSTDYVFDGSAAAPYAPSAATSPINAYGRSKLAGEQAARQCDALVVRTAWVYGPRGRSFVRTILERARCGRALRVVTDQRGAPTATPDLARMLIRLLERAAPAGTYHATNSGDTTWHGLATAALEITGIAAAVEPATTADFPTRARRPAYSVLDCSSTYAITGPAPHWREALAAQLREGV